jgi:predicted NBD/HSP70 family sugar kinase
LKSFLYLFVDTFVGGGLVIDSHLHAGVHGNAGAVASLPMALAQPASRKAHAPDQLLTHASLWELEQRFAALGHDPHAAYDERALLGSLAKETRAWVKTAANALAHCITSGMAFLDIDAVVIDGSFDRRVLALLMTQTQQALARYSPEGLWPARLQVGQVGPDARALGGALIPQHKHFAPDQDLFLKVAS